MVERTKETEGGIVVKVELDKRDIIHLLRGVEPSYDKMGLIEDMELGRYTGGFKDSFDWNYVTSVCWDKYSDEKLYELYLKLLNKL